MLELTGTLVERHQSYNLTAEVSLSKKRGVYKIEYPDGGRVAWRKTAEIS